MERLQELLVEETRSRKHSAEVRDLFEHFLAQVQALGKETPVGRLGADNFQISFHVEWDVEASHYGAGLQLHLVPNADHEDKFDCSENDAIVLTALQKLWGGELLNRVYVEECGCRTIFPVLRLAKTQVGEVVVDDACACWHEKCQQHDRDC